MKTTTRSGSDRSLLLKGFWLTIPIVIAAFFSPGIHAQNAPAVERSVPVHAGLYEVTASTADGTVWVAAIGSQLAQGARLIGLDPLTLEQRRVIEVDEAPSFGVAINNQTQTLYTSNTRVGNMSAVNLRTGEITIIRDPEAEGLPHLYRVVVDEANNLIYSTQFSDDGTVWIVDGSTNQFAGEIENVGAGPTGMVLDPQANRLYVSNQTENAIAVIDLATREVVQRIPTEGERSTQLALDAEGRRLFVANQNTDDISVIDLREGRVIRKVPTGDIALSVAFHRATNRILVANRGAGTVSVIDGSSYEKIADLEIGTFPNTIHIDEPSGRVYVTNKAAGGGRGAAPTRDQNGDKVTLIRP